MSSPNFQTNSYISAIVHHRNQYITLGNFKRTSETICETHCKKDNLSISLDVKYNIIYIRMFRAYRYRLEYSGRRQRGKSAIQICLWHRSTTWKPHNLSKGAYGQTESSRMCCLPVASCVPLPFPLRLYYFLTPAG